MCIERFPNKSFCAVKTSLTTIIHVQRLVLLVQINSAELCKTYQYRTRKTSYNTFLHLQKWFIYFHRSRYYKPWYNPVAEIIFKTIQTVLWCVRWFVHDWCTLFTRYQLIFVTGRNSCHIVVKTSRPYTLCKRVQ